MPALAERLSWAELSAGRIEVEVHRASMTPGSLFGFAERRNPKRAFLFVSNVLGRHVPVVPSAAAAAMQTLADLVPPDLPGPVLVVGMAETAIALTADQLGRADFSSAAADAPAGTPHRLIASLSASAISLSKRFLPEAEAESGLLRRLGAQTVVAATVRAIQLLGRQFVLGQTIAEALERARVREAQGFTYSYDMLGEAAMTAADAARYDRAYQDAIAAIAGACDKGSVELNPGISIKLSALHPRYEVAQQDRVMAELVPVVARLARQARAAGHTMDDELLLLATHGVLHLLGYDHMEPDEEKEMFGLQDEILGEWHSR